MKHRPNERKIKKYIRGGLPRGGLIDPITYRKAFYRADAQLTKKSRKHG